MIAASARRRGTCGSSDALLGLIGNASSAVPPGDVPGAITLTLIGDRLTPLAASGA